MDAPRNLEKKVKKEKVNGAIARKTVSEAIEKNEGAGIGSIAIVAESVVININFQF